MGRRALAVVVAGALTSGGWAGAGEAGAPRRLAGNGDVAASVRGALEGARRRLTRKTCVGILDEFRDVSGRSLRANLDALALTPDEYFDRLFFYEAERAGHCRSTGVFAMTTVRGRAIVVCGARFAAARRHDPRLTEMILIHEALHTLGLGENPPRSSEITSRVFARCGQ